MTRRNRTSRVFAAFLSGAVAAGAGQGQAQTATGSSQAAPAVAPVTVTGSRLPSAEAPRSSTCEVLAQDPFFRAQMDAGGGAGLMGPTVYLPTRFPRNPNYSAPPLSAVGSELPPILPRVRIRGRGPHINDQTIAAGPSQSIASQALSSGENAAASTDPVSLDRAIEACRLAYGVGGSPQTGGRGNRISATDARLAAGRAEIAQRDTTLPTALALFDQGRYSESLTWFQEAFRKLPDRDGGDEAALFIGKLYLQGLGDRSDPVEAVTWLKKAAGAPFNATIEMPIFDPKQPERNTAVGEAAVILGDLYLRGYRGIPKNPEEARKWYARASYVGHVPAAKVLGDLYYRGVETPRDVKKAVSYYTQGAKLNHAAAQVALADILYFGEEGVSQDRKAALAWYQAAAKNNHGGALYALAQAYDMGEGVPADPQLAVGFYKTAALQGNTAAQSALGTYFYEGKLLPKDDAVARRWFEAAAVNSDPEAMFNLAAMMSKGEGGPRDVAKAWVWLKLASALGHERAPQAVAALERRMTPAEKQAASALLGPQTRAG